MADKSLRIKQLITEEATDTYTVTYDTRSDGDPQISPPLPPNAIATFGARAEQLILHDPPRMAASGSNPIIGTDASNVSGFPADGPMWPTVIDTDECGIAGADGQYYLYASTDHAGGGTDGIWMWYADDLEGPWTIHGQVYVDNDSGQETETPCVVYDRDTDTLHMYYHQESVSGATANQTTMLATGSDGKNWTRYGVVMDLDAASDMPGATHTGYARVVRLGRLWIAYSNLGEWMWGRWFSYDGKNWQLDPHPIVLQGAHAWGDSTRKISGNIEPFLWRDQLWAVGKYTAYGSAGGATADSDIVVFRLSDDGRKVVGSPYKIAAQGAASSWNENRLANFCTFVADGILYVFADGRNSSDVNQIGVWIHDQDNTAPDELYSTSSTLVCGLQGEEIPAGRVVHEYEWSALDGSLPSWLTVGGGTGSFGGLAGAGTGVPYYQIQSGSTLNDVAKLTDNFGGFDISAFDEVRWTLEGFRVDDDTNVQINVGITGTDRGALLRQGPSNNTYATIREKRTAGNLDTDLNTRQYLLRGGSNEGQDPRNITIRILPGRELFIVMDGDQYIATHAMDSGAVSSGGTADVTFKVTAQTKEAAAKSIRLAKVKLQLIHN